MTAYGNPNPLYVIKYLQNHQYHRHMVGDVYRWMMDSLGIHPDTTVEFHSDENGPIVTRTDWDEVFTVPQPAMLGETAEGLLRPAMRTVHQKCTSFAYQPTWDSLASWIRFRAAYFPRANVLSIGLDRHAVDYQAQVGGYWI